MSVKTTADTCRDNAIDSINDALRSLEDATYPSVWGYDDYSDEYIDNMEEAIILLRKARRLL